MIILVSVKLNDIFEKDRDFCWPKPNACPRCKSCRVWGHGFVLALFDGFSQGLYLRRFRCPDCKCIIRMKPKGYFHRFQATVHTIRSCLNHRLSRGKWPPGLSKSRMRHWLWALKRKTAVFFGLDQDLTVAFDRLMDIGQVPVSRTI